MQPITSIPLIRSHLSRSRAEGRTIGFVPTMGFLHQGHMALVDRARAENDVAVVSIFVNPTQFGPGEDFATYPRDLERDLDLCRQHGVDVVFAPTVADMYPRPIETFVEVASLSSVLIGQQRPGHFRGVATVVAKLFNIVEPDRAYFGEKDFQQLAVVRRMAADLSMRVAIVGVSTVREPDGLAASSRNARLSPADRAAAVFISRSLDEAETHFRRGERNAGELIGAIKTLCAGEKRVLVRTVDVCDAATLTPIETIGEDPAVVLISAAVGDVLLIDQKELRRDAASKGTEP